MTVGERRETRNWCWRRTQVEGDCSTWTREKSVHSGRIGRRFNSRHPTFQFAGFFLAPIAYGFRNGSSCRPPNLLAPAGLFQAEVLVAPAFVRYRDHLHYVGGYYAPDFCWRNMRLATIVVKVMCHVKVVGE